MAIQGFFLRAHQCDAKLFRAGQHALDARLERRRGRQTRILNLAVLVAGRVFGAGAQFLAEEYVCNAVLHELCGKSFLIELWMPPAEWARAHVGHGRDAVCGQETDELLDGVIRMSHRIELYQIATSAFPRKHYQGTVRIDMA